MEHWLPCQNALFVNSENKFLCFDETYGMKYTANYNTPVRAFKKTACVNICLWIHRLIFYLNSLCRRMIITALLDHTKSVG